MAFPVIDSNRVIIVKAKTQAAADAAAAGDAALTAPPGDRGSFRVGQYLPAAGAAADAVPRTAAQEAADLLRACADHADAACDLILPSWYLRAGMADAEATARYEQTRCWVICAVACIQAAARAPWTTAQLRGLRAAQLALMPLNAATIRRWYSAHTTGAGQGWTSACEPDQGSDPPTVTGHFFATSASRADAPPAFGDDFAVPRIWDGSGGTIAVTLQRNAAPQDFAAV